MRLSGLLLLAAACLFGQIDRTDLDEGFDKPLKKTVVDLGPSPFYRASQHVRNKLTCRYYSTFTVKEYDQGEKGAEWLSIVPFAQAECTQRHEVHEKVYTSEEWSGYFRGVKGTVVFFDAPDGEDGGMAFAAFDVGTGRKLFEDSSLLDYSQEQLQIKNAFQVSTESDQTLRLTYFRVVRAGCNLKAEQWDCWNKVRAELGITQTDKPICSRYEKADWESAIVYRVSVALTDSPQIKAVDGPVFCWPID